jgi:hypothetical protein
MMMMSPTFTTLVTTSPTIAPLHDGPFSVVVTSASGPDFEPLTMCPPVTIVPEPETIR